MVVFSSRAASPAPATPPAKPPAASPARLAWLLPLALALGPLPALGWLQLRPAVTPAATPRPVALVFPPWWSGTRAILAAAPAGAVIRFGAWPSIVIIQPDPAARTSPAATGAWAILDPRFLGGCTPLPDTQHDT